MPAGISGTLEAILDALEEREGALLVWGLVDGSFSTDELTELVNGVIDAAIAAGDETILDAQKAIEELLTLKWIVEVDGVDGQTHYRSRMAETVRLLLRLRQLFPKHARTDSGWQLAPTLVADFRFQRRQRQYPLRDVLPQKVLAEVRDATEDPTVLAVVRTFLESSGDLKTGGLSGFQVRATKRILQALEKEEALGTIVSAGTGSGKTLAFYLPALASIVRHKVAPEDGAWVKTVAIYPRTELLKDQLREVLTRVLRLTASLRGKQAVKVRVGALYGDTPESADRNRWKKVGQDLVCPTLNCLRCNSELHWRVADYSAGRERLTCANQECNFTLDDSIFAITRRRLAADPPDILFSTTEMLNQRLTDSRLGQLFGVGRAALRAPELVLLDEVHTYEGRQGAQVGYLMRRWQRLAEQPLRFVGLSATLREAADFFSSLTGTSRSLVQEVSPRTDELISEGAEYQIALRGDPVSRAALLSTTIQAAMLLQRCLDPSVPPGTRSISQGLYGRRTFVFTDDLDVTNRLYFNLLDAEGRDSGGRANMRTAPDGGLAVLRRRGISKVRYHAGQDWRGCEDIGHQLSTRLAIERVSSQDRGVSQEADVVVATAALEVGFDDPSVGAVLQHKAPRGMASYLQRKGRAGRSRGMRPWSVVVLSDYGRDRNAYQNYDLLFDPELPVRTLPLGNRYVSRIQAAYAAMDYLAMAMQDAPKGSVWNDLSQPSWSDIRKSRLTKEIRAVLETERGAQRLAGYLGGALKLPQSEVAALLWEFPRPLMSTVLPTALRRVASGWRAQGEAAKDYRVRNNPLPEFVPASLFADLNLAEVRIDLPNPSLEPPVMSLFPALREFAPGRVSRRFGVRHRSERYWIAPPNASIETGAPGFVNLQQVGEMAWVGAFSVVDNGQVRRVPVFRPTSITPQQPGINIGDTSNARLTWHTQLVPLREPEWLSPPGAEGGATVFQRIGFFLHSAQLPTEVRRFATGSVAEVGVGRGNQQRIEISFSSQGAAAALGGAFQADGVVFQIAIPQRLNEQSRSGDQARALRTARFLDEAWRGVRLPSVASPFVREWLSHIQLSALTYEAIENKISLEEAAVRFQEGRATLTLNQVLGVLFQSQAIEVDDENIGLSGQDRLRQELDQLLSDPSIRAELSSASKRLWEPITDEWELWLRDVYHATLGSALLAAITDLCPSVDPENLVVDLSRGAPDGAHDYALPKEGWSEIWITEQGPGGNGHIEEFMRRYAEDPRRFFSMTRASLDVGDFELVDRQLSRLLDVLSSSSMDVPTKAVINRMRASNRQVDIRRLSKELRAAMVKEGFLPFHGFMVSVNSRILKPGAGQGMDRYLASALRRWDAEEARLGIEIDLRVICYWLSQTAEIDSVAGEIGLPRGADLGAWRLSAVYGLLWGRGRSIRQAALQTRHPFVERPPVERLLVIDSLGEDRKRVSIEEDEWLETVTASLSKGRLVTLTCRDSNGTALSEALNLLICNPVESGYLRSYARLQGLRRVDQNLEADVELLEAVQ